MNIHVTAFGKLSEEQQGMVQRAITIEAERHELYNEVQYISRKLGYQGINLWEEMRELINRPKAIVPTESPSDSGGRAQRRNRG